MLFIVSEHGSRGQREWSPGVLERFGVKSGQGGKPSLARWALDGELFQGFTYVRSRASSLHGRSGRRGRSLVNALALADLDRELNDFRGSLPTSPMDVDHGLAAQAVAFAIAVFMAALSGYIRVIGAQQLFSYPGTIFEALLGPRVTAFLGYFVLIIPLRVLYRLGSAVGWMTQTGIVVAACAAVVDWATLGILRRPRPHLKFAGQRKF